jgi:hypothetical protein
MDTTETIKERIRKLLAMAASANENEAALAMGFAQELLIKYRLTEAELHDSIIINNEPIIKDEEPLFMAGRIPGWKSQLATMLATFNNCRLVKYGYSPSADQKRGTKLIIFGRQTDIDNVRFLLGYAVVTLTNLSVFAIIGGGHSYAQSWFLGAVAGISEKLYEGKKRAQVGFSKFTIIKVEHQLDDVDDFISESVGKLRKGTGSNTKINSEAYNQGHKAGKSVDLNSTYRPKATLG